MTGPRPSQTAAWRIIAFLVVTLSMFGFLYVRFHGWTLAPFGAILTYVDLLVCAVFAWVFIYLIPYLAARRSRSASSKRPVV
jgi:uncharacterized membrane protein